MMDVATDVVDEPAADLGPQLKWGTIEVAGISYLARAGVYAEHYPGLDPTVLGGIVGDAVVRVCQPMVESRRPRALPRAFCMALMPALAPVDSLPLAVVIKYDYRAEIEIDDGAVLAMLRACHVTGVSLGEVASQSPEVLVGLSSAVMSRQWCVPVPRKKPGDPAREITAMYGAACVTDGRRYSRVTAGEMLDTAWPIMKSSLKDAIHSAGKIF